MQTIWLNVVSNGGATNLTTRGQTFHPILTNFSRLTEITLYDMVKKTEEAILRSRATLAPFKWGQNLNIQYFLYSLYMKLTYIVPSIASSFK